MKLIFKRIISKAGYIIFFGVICLRYPSVANAATQITGTPTTNSNQIGRYQKFEITFQISRKFPDMAPAYNPPRESFLPYYYYDANDAPSRDPGRNAPYGEDGITIDGHFTSPSGKNLTVPAFYYQDYGGSKAYSWKIRFAPEELGNYTYYITLQDKGGSSRYPSSGTSSFQSTSSSSKGFVRVSSRDPRFWETSNGESFIPISTGHQWSASPQGVGQYYNGVFSAFKQHGINFLRIWDQNDSYKLTVEGHFDGYNWPDDFNPRDRGIDLETIPKGTQMNQRGNYEEDIILSSAEQNGVYIQLCSHGDPYWIWDKTTYWEDYDSWTMRYNVRADDWRYVNYWKRNFRYRVARWGYSTAVFAWERWNEHGHVLTNSDTYSFYQTYGQYQKQTDPYNHLRTTSQGSQAYSPGLWSSSAFDIVNYHDYQMSNRYSASLHNDTANFVYRFGQCLRAHAGVSCGLGIGDGSNWSGADKPIVWGEWDTGTSAWDQANPQPVADHNVIWAGLFSPIGMVPIDWYYDQKNYNAQKYDWLKVASDYFSNIDYAGERFDYLSTGDVRINSETINAGNSNMRVLAIRSNGKNKAFAWVQHKSYTWNNSGTPSAISGTFTIPQMANGSYTVEYWNTETGQKTNGGTVSASGGNLTINVSGLNKSMAIKAVSTSLPPNTPTPTLRPSPACAGPADIDCDGQVGAGDALAVFNTWLTAGSEGEDINDDGKVNGMDIGDVIKDWTI